MWYVTNLGRNLYEFRPQSALGTGSLNVVVTKFIRNSYELRMEFEQVAQMCSIFVRNRHKSHPDTTPTPINVHKYASPSTNTHSPTLTGAPLIHFKHLSYTNTGPSTTTTRQALG